MENILVLLGIILTVVMSVSLRSMRDEHLYAISIRLELGVWFIFTLSLAGHLFGSLQESFHIPAIVQMILLGLMLSRILTSASFILGNPPKVHLGNPVRQKSNNQTQPIHLVHPKRRKPFRGQEHDHTTTFKTTQDR